MSEYTNICYNCFCERTIPMGSCTNCGYDPEWDREKYPLALPHGHFLCNRYMLGRVLGQGGYGITYLAWDCQLNIRIAIKEYFPEAAAFRVHGNPQVTLRSPQKQNYYQKGKKDFLQEARVLAEFMYNPNVVRIYGYFEENQTAYFVMDYVQGITFQKYVINHGCRISWQDACERFLPIINALEAVHSKGIVHRDISLENIYINYDGTVKLLDFGAARQQSLNESHSLDVILKRGYSPPEQYYRRGKQGPFTDVYALSACFYGALTGMLPPDALERIKNDKLQLFSTQGIDVPKEIAQVLYKGLEVDLKNRYQNMTEFRIALETAIVANTPQMQVVSHSNPSQSQVSQATNYAQVQMSSSADHLQQQATPEAEKSWKDWKLIALIRSWFSNEK